MADIDSEIRDKMRRSITQEFVRAESDFDDTRNIRLELVGKLRAASSRVNLVAENGAVSEDTDTGLRVIALALKSIDDVEKAGAKMISMKQKQQEQSLQSAAASKDRIEIIIKATAPGRIQENEVSDQDLESHLEDMFGGDIKDFELRTSAKDLAD